MRGPFFRGDRRLLLGALIFALGSVITYAVVRAFGLVP